MEMKKKEPVYNSAVEKDRKINSYKKSNWFTDPKLHARFMFLKKNSALQS